MTCRQFSVSIYFTQHLTKPHYHSIAIHNTLAIRNIIPHAQVRHYSCVLSYTGGT